MYFSLVLATVDRTSELERFLLHLDGQSCRDFELIVVDQNVDGRLDAVLEPYKARFSLVHLRTDKRGLSLARNIGIVHCRGEVLAFPDDDCWYPPDLLDRVRVWLQEHPGWQGLSGRTADARDKDVLGRYARWPGPITKYGIWHRINSNTIFLYRALVEAIGGFDESLGLGAGTPWCAAEDVDLPLRAMRDNYRLYYDPAFKVGHPDPLFKYDPTVIMRAYTYSCGMGRVLAMHDYPAWFVFYYLLRPLGGCLVSASCGKWPQLQYHWNIYRGRLKGWLSKRQ